MFFILGVLSTASLSAWLMVTGADFSVMYAHSVVVGKAAKNLINMNDWIIRSEMENAIVKVVSGFSVIAKPAFPQTKIAIA